MKILLLTDRMESGGVETHVLALSRGLKEMGQEVTLCAADGRMLADAREGGIRVLAIPALSARSPQGLWRARRALRACIREGGFDILHAHTRRTAFLLRGLGRLCNAAEVVTVHAHFRPLGLLRRLCYWGERTVAVSEDLRRYVCREYRLPPERVEVIANGIDLLHFRIREKGDRRPMHSILFASRLDADCAMGARLLCELAPTLAARFPDLRIGIAGGGDALCEIRQRAKEANRAIGRHTVTVYGGVRDMAPLLQRHTLFLGVSRAAMEAAACGCAVILGGDEGFLGPLSQKNEARALLSNLTCRGSEKMEKERLLRELLALLEDPLSLRTVAAEGRASVCRYFDIRQMCRRTLALYHRVRHTPPTATLTVGGYFGCGNLGDDAMLEGLLEGLRAASPALRVQLLSPHPRTDRARYGLSCVHRASPFGILRALLQSDAFLCGGGSLLQNATSNRSLLYYLFLLRLAALLKRKPILFAAGIGPLYGRRMTALSVRTLARCAYVSLRDPHSRTRLETLGVDPALLHGSADPALLSPHPPASRALALLQGAGIQAKEGGFLCLVLRGDLPPPLLQTVTAAVRMLCHRHALALLLLAMDRRRDTEVSARVAARLEGKLIPTRESADAEAILSCAALTVSLRLHGVVLATKSGGAALGVCTDPHDPKLPAFCAAVGQRCLCGEEITVAALVEEMESALSSATAMRPVLADSVAQMRKKTQKDLENIRAMIYNKRSN